PGAGQGADPRRASRVLGGIPHALLLRPRDVPHGGRSPSPGASEIRTDAHRVGPPVCCQRRRDGASHGTRRRGAWRVRQRSAQRTGRAMMMFRDEAPGGSPATHDDRAGGPAPGKAPVNWTVLAYLAGDNDLEGSLLADLREMERVGSRPGSVEILAQI